MFVWVMRAGSVIHKEKRALSVKTSITLTIIANNVNALTGSLTHAFSRSSNSYSGGKDVSKKTKA